MLNPNEDSALVKRLRLLAQQAERLRQERSNRERDRILLDRVDVHYHPALANSAPVSRSKA